MRTRSAPTDHGDGNAQTDSGADGIRGPGPRRPGPGAVRRPPGTRAAPGRCPAAPRGRGARGGRTERRDGRARRDPRVRGVPRRPAARDARGQSRRRRAEWRRRARRGRQPGRSRSRGRRQGRRRHRGDRQVEGRDRARAGQGHGIRRAGPEGRPRGPAGWQAGQADRRGTRTRPRFLRRARRPDAGTAGHARPAAHAADARRWPRQRGALAAGRVGRCGAGDADARARPLLRRRQGRAGGARPG